MNGSILLRILWKEVRAQRAFWIAMLVLAVLAQAAALVFAYEGDRLLFLYSIAMVVPALYALGCGAILFAAEHESEMYEFQRILPVTSGRLFFSKLVLPVLAVPAMIGVLWLVAALLARGHFLPGRDQVHLWGLWGFAAIEALAWSVGFSLVTKRTINAAILGVAAGSFAVHLAAAGHIGSSVYRYWEAGLYTSALPARAAIVAVVAVADVWLGLRWLRVQPAETRHAMGPCIPVAHEAGASGPALLRQNGGFGRLVWQHWRQSRRLMGTVWLAMLLFALAAMVILPAPGRGYDGFFLMNWLFSLIAAALMGTCTFIPDQQGLGFRFLAERGVSPGRVWLSRQMVWGLPTLVVTLMIAALSLPISSQLFGDRLAAVLRHRHDIVSNFSRAAMTIVDLGTVFRMVVCVPAAYAAAQLCSMVFRSSVLAGFCGLLLAALLVVWTNVLAELGIPLLWSVLPIPIVLLLATWARAPGWLMERRTVKAWVPTVSVLAVPAVAILAGVAAYRVYSVGLTDPGFSPERYARPATAAERATLDLYRQAAARFSFEGSEQARGGSPNEEDPSWIVVGQTAVPRLAETQSWVEANPEAISIALEASRRNEADFFDPLDTDRIDQSVAILSQLVRASGTLLESKGKLEEALERYLAALRISIHLRHRSGQPVLADSLEFSVYDHLTRWAAHPRQTAGTILAAARQIEGLTKDLPEPSTAIKSGYLLLLGLVSAEPEAIAGGRITPQQAFRISVWNKLPWERQRAIRLLNVLTAENLRRWQEAARAAEKSGRIAFPRREPNVHYIFDPAIRTTPLLDWCYPTVDQMIDELLRSFARIETKRRAVRLILALEAYRAEHGRLPDSLDAFKGRYLEQLPVDPMSGESFRYFPEGVAVRLATRSPEMWFNEAVDPGMPFIWSMGGDVQLASPRRTVNSNLEKYQICFYFMEQPRPPTSEIDIWQAGWLFPIPERQE
ncbi:MAG: hypothetical protein HUU20_00030 [Pirellulales bacterium]|nr:hypothetical protein [Pirellulales bacterium]